VLDRRTHVPLGMRDVYAATVGGVRVVDPAADLALAVAVAGAHTDRAAPARLAAVGEVGLAGEVRPVSAIRGRVAEAARLGFRCVLVPRGSTGAVPGIEVVEVATLGEALAVARVQ
jgi:DNA repair protein RadA/Sms